MWFVYEAESQNNAFWKGSAEDIFQIKFHLVHFEWTDQPFSVPVSFVGLGHRSRVSGVANTLEYESRHPIFS